MIKIKKNNALDSETSQDNIRNYKTNQESNKLEQNKEELSESKISNNVENIRI